MPHLLDPGCFQETSRTQGSDYPGADVYPPDPFRVERGPIFRRGRLDGSARLLAIGQDPAEHETIVRRIPVDEAGRPVQGFLARLGVTGSHALVNIFLSSVFENLKAKTYRRPDITSRIPANRLQSHYPPPK